MNDLIDLSIVVATYNHEAYIKKAIESICAQKTTYRYEVLIGDDCSTDKTQTILKEFKKVLPENFHMILRDQNVGPEQNFNDLYRRTQGRYLAVLEGDDYWIDENKIQIQISYLERHPECIATAHNVKVIDENDCIRTDYVYPECKSEKYTLYDFRKGLYCGQTASIISRNYYKDHYFELFKPSVKWAGDRSRNFLFATYGEVYCFQKVMSAYRYVNSSGGSYSAVFKKDEDAEKRFLYYHRDLYNYAKEYAKTNESILVTESMYFKYYLSALIKKKFSGLSYRKFFRELKSCKYFGKTITFIIFMK